MDGWMAAAWKKSANINDAIKAYQNVDMCRLHMKGHSCSQAKAYIRNN